MDQKTRDRRLAAMNVSNCDGSAGNENVIKIGIRVL